MSLSSLFTKTQHIDKELDLLFNVAVSPFKKLATPGSSNETKKRKFLEEQKISRPVKKSKGKLKEEPQKVLVSNSSKRKGTGLGKAKEEDDEEDNSDLENDYLTGKTAAKPPQEQVVNALENFSDEGEPSEIVHESMLTKPRNKQSRSRTKTKWVPQDETLELRNARTIFVGNIPVEVALQKPLLKRLQRHILDRIPGAKIESARFRSIPFQNPTSKLPTSEDEGSPPKISKIRSDPNASKNVRPHDRERISTWRDRNVANDDDSGKSDDKKFLNPKQKKKIAFINQEFHPTADTMNAYIVFAHAQPVENRPSNLPSPTLAMDPFQAARLAAEKCDGTLFMERIIRVDVVSKQAKEAREPQSVVDGNPKLTVFVGNLDFASKEGDLRVFFEGVVSGERGPPGGASDSEGGVDGKKPKTWVTRVRIVRDRDTQLGKGFAYVQFADRECVDEVLALEPAKVKFAKRTLRLLRCKTLPGAASTLTKRPASAAVKLHPSARPTTRSAPSVVVPKGDPNLGEKLANLPKDARKEYKSADADRVARRLAKKKARIALGNRGVKVNGKERDRVRKGATLNKGAAPKKKEGKVRVRSDNSLSRRNIKK